MIESVESFKYINYSRNDLPLFNNFKKLTVNENPNLINIDVNYLNVNNEIAKILDTNSRGPDTTSGRSDTVPKEYIITTPGTSKPLLTNFDTSSSITDTASVTDTLSKKEGKKS